MSSEKKDTPIDAAHASEELVADDLADEIYFNPDEKQHSWRAAIVGTLLGFLIAASNMYLGLQIGFTFGAGLFGAIFGFAIVKPMSKYLPAMLGGGGHFGPRENCVLQTYASAAGGLSMFVAAVPAMYSLGVLSMKKGDDGKSYPDINADIGRLFAFCTVSTLFGSFFGIPLRKFFVVQRTDLTFPSATAAAMTIRTLHTAEGEAVGKRKAKYMAIAFACAFAWVVGQFYFPRLLNYWNVFAWIYEASGNTATWAAQMESWRFYLSWTPAFIGVGMLTGTNASFSLELGSIMCWGILGPLLVANGLATGSFDKADPGKNLRNYFSSLPPSPRYWIMWVGVSIMFCSAFTEMACNWKTIQRGLIIGIKNLTGKMTEEEKVKFQETAEKDMIPADQQVTTTTWVVGLIVSVTINIAVLWTLFGVGVLESLLAVILGFIFSFIGLEAAGSVDINPIGTIAKASQLVFAGITGARGLPIGEARLLNLLSGSVAGSAASQAVDMVGDLKTGYLLRTSAAAQFWAQIWGSFASVFVSVGMFYLFATAYPCILDAQGLVYKECPKFGLPAVAAWTAVAKVLTDPKATALPNGCGWGALGFGVASIIGTYLRNVASPTYKKYYPSWASIGVAFVLPATHYSHAAVIGALVAMVCTKRFPKWWEVAGIAIASGMIAGEGIGGLAQAIFQLTGVESVPAWAELGCPQYLIKKGAC